MPKTHRSPSSLVSPITLTPFDPDDADPLVVIIETPKGSRNKYAFEPDERIFSLTEVLPAGMEFPYDFGFVPSTLAGDGDPLDALVLMDEPAFPGCRLSCRPVGIIEGEEGEKNDAERNDRIVCVEKGNHSYTHVKHIDDLGKTFEKELEDFFVNYHELSGKAYRILGIKGPAQARRQVKACRKAARHRHAYGYVHHATSVGGQIASVMLLPERRPGDARGRSDGTVARRLSVKGADDGAQVRQGKRWKGQTCDARDEARQAQERPLRH